ncbi:DUF6745 domain-containing protein [Kitasatospora aureofaciens]|uniref:DUF6745 domain-containing protein n=1 Tax=Kitasatospora aureofaciens TaxID=1894 RepID=UPI0036F45D84
MPRGAGGGPPPGGPAPPPPAFPTRAQRRPPSTRTARAGVAWTFGIPETAYHPQRETRPVRRPAPGARRRPAGCAC